MINMEDIWPFLNPELAISAMQVVALVAEEQTNSGGPPKNGTPENVCKFGSWFSNQGWSCTA